MQRLFLHRQAIARAFLHLLLSLVIVFFLSSCVSVVISDEVPDAPEGDDGKSSGTWMPAPGTPSFEFNGNGEYYYTIIPPDGAEGESDTQNPDGGQENNFAGIISPGTSIFSQQGSDGLHYIVITPTDSESEADCHYCDESGFDACQGHPCPSCSGNAHSECDRCSGKGTLDGELTCKSCEGTGTVNCRTCGGDGVIFYARYQGFGTTPSPVQP